MKFVKLDFDLGNLKIFNCDLGNMKIFNFLFKKFEKLNFYLQICILIHQI